MSRSRTDGRRRTVRRLSPAAAVCVGLLLVGHLVGGGSDRVAACVLTAATALLLLALSLWERLPYSPAYRRTLAWLCAPFAVLMAWAAVAVIPGSDVLSAGSLARIAAAPTLAIDGQAAGLEFLKLGALAMAVLAAERLAASAQRLRQTLKLLIWSGVAWTLWAMVLLALHAGLSGTTRLSGAFVSPNIAGALIVISLLLLVGDNPPREDLSGGRAQGFKRLTPLLQALILMAGLVLTASRACTLLGLTLAGALWLWPRRHALTPAEGAPPGWRLVFGIAAAAFGGVGLLTGADLVSRLSRTSNDAVDRGAIMGLYADAAREAPLAGYGLGSASPLSRLLLSRDNYSFFFNIRAAHNWVVQWWVEGGLVGLSLVVILLAITAVRLGRGLGPRGRLALGGPLSALVFLVLHGLVDYDVQIFSLALTAAWLLGLSLAGVGHSDRHWDRFKGRSRRKRPADPIPSSPNAGLDARFSLR